MNQVLTGLLLFITLYILLDVFLKYHTLGLFPHQIQSSLFGDIDEYIDPMPKSVFLEFIHIEIFFSMMILLTLNAVFIRLNHLKSFTLTLTNITMISALLSLVSITLIYFFSTNLLFIYIASFFIWHFTALYMTLISLKRLHFA